MEGAQERDEQIRRKLQDKLLRTLLRVGFRTGKVCEPVHKIQCNIAGLRLALPDDLLEAVEQHARGSLSLNQPSEIELHVELCKLHRFALCLGESRVGGEHRGHPLQHVPERCIVVVDHFANLVLLEWPTLFRDHGEQAVHLHDVVDGCQDQECQSSLRIVRTVAEAALEEARRDKNFTNLCHVHGSVKGLTPAEIVGAPDWHLTVVCQWLPICPNAIDERLKAIAVQAH
mmetsp:Transcript_15614/g.36850  ORF Transcript_15614/g.36850 Transcript_15614/m.36850 type:complete len:230 (+) Transcript_15614:177-866(+)